MTPELFLMEACTNWLSPYSAVVLEDVQQYAGSIDLEAVLAIVNLCYKLPCSSLRVARFQVVLEILKDNDGKLVKKLQTYFCQKLDHKDLITRYSSKTPLPRINDALSVSDVPVVCLDSTVVTNTVDTLYLSSPCSNYIVKALETVRDIYLRYPLSSEGDILVFLADNNEIAYLKSLLESPDNRDVNSIVMPLFDDDNGQLHHSDYIVSLLQGMRSFRRERLVILASPNCDTDEDLLISGNVRFVIDTGFIRTNSCGSIVPISKFSADFRRQLASRHTLNGICLRLYTQEAAVGLLMDATDSTYIEHAIKPTTISASPALVATLLQLASCNEHKLSLLSFPYFTKPNPAEFASALSMLNWLGAIDTEGKITAIGRTMARFPPSMVPLGVSRIFALAAHSGSSKALCQPILKLIATVSVGGLSTIFVTPRGQAKAKETVTHIHRQFQACEGDYVTLVNIIDAYIRIRSDKRKSWCMKQYLNFDTLHKATEVYTELSHMFSELINTGGLSNEFSYDSCGFLVELIAQGLFLCLAKYDDRRGKFVVVSTGEDAEVHRASVYGSLDPMEMRSIIESPWFVYETIERDRFNNLTLKGLTNVARKSINDTKYYEEKSLYT